jgi:hypothetical protein
LTAAAAAKRQWFSKMIQHEWTSAIVIQDWISLQVLVKGNKPAFRAQPRCAKYFIGADHRLDDASAAYMLPSG